jgi:hypothetical protein
MGTVMQSDDTPHEHARMLPTEGGIVFDTRVFPYTAHILPADLQPLAPRN